MSEQSNRRKAVRWRTELECRFEYGGQSHAGRLSDLSEQGAFLSAEVLPALQDTVVIYFSSGPGRQESSLAALVRHCRRDAQGNPVGFGVEFQDVPPQVYSELESIVVQPTFLKKRK